MDNMKIIIVEVMMEYVFQFTIYNLQSIFKSITSFYPQKNTPQSIKQQTLHKY